jgi:hypothetical protein
VSQAWLFGVVVGAITSILVLITLISSLVFDGYAQKGYNVFFGVCILLICISHLILVSVPEFPFSPNFLFLVLVLKELGYRICPSLQKRRRWGKNMDEFGGDWIPCNRSSNSLSDSICREFQKCHPLRPMKIPLKLESLAFQSSFKLARC